MAHHRRRRPRLSTHSVARDLNNWPAYWDILFHRRPRRRAAKKLMAKIKSGRLDPDDTAWPLGNHKPHHYYW